MKTNHPSDSAGSSANRSIFQVIRTRLRQAPLENGRPKYTGLVQCFRLIAKEEGMAGLYGGLTPHMVRSIPSAIITLGVYEAVLRFVGTPA